MLIGLTIALPPMRSPPPPPSNGRRASSLTLRDLDGRCQLMGSLASTYRATLITRDGTFNIDSFSRERCMLAAKKFTTWMTKWDRCRFPCGHSLLFNCRRLASLHTGACAVTGPGPGRIDAFGKRAWATCFQDRHLRGFPWAHPICFPAPWGCPGSLRVVPPGTVQHQPRSWSAILGRQSSLGAIADFGRSGASRRSRHRADTHIGNPFFSRLSPPHWSPEDQFPRR